MVPTLLLNAGTMEPKAHFCKEEGRALTAVNRGKTDTVEDEKQLGVNAKEDTLPEKTAARPDSKDNMAVSAVTDFKVLLKSA
ncbi:hypothetical protein [Rhizobium sp. L1K21]|uniref:hypothetical protein n=1 Tax=Rhizobium sp. L1K21 TaxID=2954933 RepID=UPI002092236C|nr:hypothetical protein [Rhizobium sp. L1K21]MCO6188286.1 hypothetical protein [Rhizobium sp. L1K21]